MIDWFMPYFKMQESWEYKQIADFNMTGFIPVLVTVAEKYENSEYLDIIPNLKSMNSKITMPAGYSFADYNYLTCK